MAEVVGEKKPALYRVWRRKEGPTLKGLARRGRTGETALSPFHAKETYWKRKDRREFVHDDWDYSEGKLKKKNVGNEAYQ